MGKLVDRTGKSFGALTVVNRAENDAHGNAYWVCVCACGTQIITAGNSLQSGKTKSCGCLHRKRTSETHLIDITGQKFGRLTVINRKGTVRAQGRNAVWECICECGKLVTTTGGCLRSGHTRSCGCFKRDRTAERMTGESHHSWKGGVTDMSDKIRHMTEYIAWRTSTFEKDSYTCQMCGQRGGRLNADHIKPFSQVMEENGIRSLKAARECEELWSPSNGRTLCEPCHRKTETYGGRAVKKEKVNR